MKEIQTGPKRKEARRIMEGPEEKKKNKDVKKKKT